MECDVWVDILCTRLEFQIENKLTIYSLESHLENNSARHLLPGYTETFSFH